MEYKSIVINVGNQVIPNLVSSGQNISEQNEKESKEEEAIDLKKLCRDAVKEYQIATLNCQRSQTNSKLKTKKKYDPDKYRIPHSAMWQHNFKKLLAFRKKYNHCHVPVKYDPDPSLARWVKRQRYHHMLYASGKQSPIKQERIRMLENIGFTWNAQEALWQERLSDLKEFKKKHGHCAIPTIFPKHQTLATWVKFQRRQYKLYMNGQRTYMTADRIETLEKLGFQWKQRSYVNDFIDDV